MAETKSSVTARIGLPEKEWFTLAEIAKQWGCSEVDLLQYGATGTLKICHLFKQAIADWKRKVCTDNGFTTNDLDQNVLIKEGIVGLGNPGNIYRIGRRDLLSLLRGETIKPWAIYPAIENTDGQLTFGIIKKRCQFGIVGGHLFPDATDEEPLVDTLKTQSLVLTREDLHRFEKEHTGACAAKIPDFIANEPPENLQGKSALLLEYIALERAAQISGLNEQEILDLAALAKIQAGLIVPGLEGHAIPRYVFSASHVHNGEYQSGKFVASHYYVKPDNGDAQIVEIFPPCNFWVIGGDIKQLALVDEPLEITCLWPQKGADLSELKQFIPWPESVVILEEPFTIRRSFLRFVRVEIEGLAHDRHNLSEQRFREIDEKNSEFRPGSWQTEAFEIAKRLDPEHKEPHMGAFAMQIHRELRLAGVVNRYKVTPPAQTVEREVLRGWKTADK